MYKFQDVSSVTSPELMRPRTLRRRGILLHETIGDNSLPYLQGGSLLDGRKVSADYHVARDGTISQITPPGYYAFHSGVARWMLYQESDRSINQGYVGIETENNPEKGQITTGPQYIALGFLCRVLLLAHHLDIRCIVGHYQVALPHGRKQDPVTLNWSMLSVEMLSPSTQASMYVVRGNLS